MIFFNSVVTIAGFVVVLALNDKNENPTIDLIVGGSSAKLGQIPYQVGLRHKQTKKHFCGGVIIHEMWIVSCAHCMYENYSDKSTLEGIDTFYGAVGTIEIDAGTYYDFAERIFHPNGFDIVLLKTKIKINFNKQTKPIAMNINDPLIPDSVVTVSGWGALRFKGAQPKILQFIEAKIATPSECKRGPERFCTKRLKVGDGACFGDSGGPVVFESKLVGITQSGNEKCTYLDKNMNIGYFQPWIKSHIGS